MTRRPLPFRVYPPPTGSQTQVCFQVACPPEECDLDTPGWLTLRQWAPDDPDAALHLALVRSQHPDVRHRTRLVVRTVTTTTHVTPLPDPESE